MMATPSCEQWEGSVFEIDAPLTNLIFAGPLPRYGRFVNGSVWKQYKRNVAWSCSKVS